MNKRLFILLGVIYFISNCTKPKIIKSSNSLYFDIGNSYKIPDYNIVLKTRDSVYFLSKPSVLINGKIEAKTKKRSSGKGKKIIIISKSLSKNVVEHITDSTGKKTDHIQFSDRGVSKVLVYDTFAGRDRRLIYGKGFNWVGLIILIVGILGTIGLIAFLLDRWAANMRRNRQGQGCYIATMVYGNYDASEVVVLRKFRDEKLAVNPLGRIFIKIYYLLSPGFVKFFKNNKAVNKFVKSILDWWVKKLGNRE